MNQNNGKSLILYFSETGNTKDFAEYIHKETKADIIRLETVKPYPKEFNDLLAYAAKEKEEHARPELKTVIENIADYNMIYLGYPIWHEEMPMPIYSFLDKYDLSGKTIAPFSTSRASGLIGTPEKIQKAEPNAIVTRGLSFTSGNFDEKVVNEWLSEISKNQEQNIGNMISIINENIRLKFKLNSSNAAKELFDQLPLRVKVYNFGDNEKIFYLNKKLNISNTPLAKPEIGTLAYYEPWGNVAIFYDKFNTNNNLYELGQIVEGMNLISSLTGTVTVTKG